MADKNQKTRMRIDGMDCAACAAKIDRLARTSPGVREVNVSATAGTMVLEHDETTDLDQIAAGVGKLGYRVMSVGPGTKSAKIAAASDDAGCNHNHSGHAHEKHGHAQHDHGAHKDGDHAHGESKVDDKEPRLKGEPDDKEDALLESLHGHDHGTSDGPWWATAKARLTLICGIALGAAFLIAHIAPAYKSVVFVLAMAIGLIPIARRAYAAASVGMPFTIETLMTIAAIGAVVIDASEEAAAVVFLFLVGELLEGVAAGRARASIRALATLVPKTALLEEDGKTTEISAEELAVGATILVRPGDRIPADGTIISGDTAVDEAPVTGESVPKRKGPDDAVFAGTINQDAAIRVAVTAAAEDNTIARIIRLVEEAQESKAPTERFIDSFSKYYTPAVMVVAALIAVIPPLAVGADWSEWIYKGLAVLLIGCPCALVISTPAAIAASLSAGARRGMLMKGGAVLEALGKVTKVAFDKTGTLTAGKPVVTDVLGVTGDEDETLRLAAALEVGSSHPLALAILNEAKTRGIASVSATNSRAIGGEGVVGSLDGAELFLGSPQAAAKRAPLPEGLDATIAKVNDAGKTVSLLLKGEQVTGMIAMRDEPREDAKAGVQALKDLGIGSVMLTGDNRRTAAAIAAGLGMEPRAELLPQDKQRIVGEMRASGDRVAKVGDGINDAPALAAADVGIAMGGGTDVALETADAAVLNGRVTDVAGMVMLSRATMSNIWQNITIALGLKAVFLVTTVLGITGLWPAILADTGATVLVTANAMRLLAWKPKT